MNILGNLCYFEFLFTHSLYLLCCRRDEFGGRRYEPRGASPERKVPVNTGRSFAGRKFDDSTRERYSDKYDSGNSKWNTLPENSWGGNDHRSWHSNTGFESSRISMHSNIGSSSLSRLHPGSEITQVGGISSRGYYGSNNRRY